MKQLLLSIIVPVYDAASSIGNCLDSILAQTSSNFEVIAIDDGSTDNSLEILKRYAANDPRIKVYHFANSGVSVSRHRGISLATGDYLLFVDSDDTVSPGLFERINSAIETFGFPDVIRYQCKLIGDPAHKDHERYNFSTSLNVSMTGIEALKMWSVPGKKYSLFWLFAFKKTVFVDIPHLSALKCHEDVALIPILIAKSERVVTIEFCGYNYYSNNLNSLSNAPSKAAEESRARDFLEAFKYVITNLRNIPCISAADIAFLSADFERRLEEKFNSLDKDLQVSLAHLYHMYMRG